MNNYRDIPDRAALERAYSPSSCVPDVQDILRDYVVRSDAARARSGQARTVPYGPHRDEAMDIFPGPGQSAARPVLAYIHGGYWQELSKREHSFPAIAANAAGLTYVAINYGLAPGATLDQMVDRCRRAVLGLHERAAELNIDPTAIHLAGCSAGAQLASMVAMTDWAALGVRRNPVRSLVLLSGVYDLRPLLLTYVNDALGLTAEAAVRNSPMLLIDAFQGALPPALLAVGDNETAEFKRQSEAFADRLGRKGVRAELQLVAGRNHFDLIFDLLEPDTRFGAATLRHLGLSLQK